MKLLHDSKQNSELASRIPDLIVRSEARGRFNRTILRALGYAFSQANIRWRMFHAEEDENGNSDGMEKIDGIRSREFRILKMPAKTRRRSLAERARNSFRARGNSETPATAVAAVGSAPRRCKNTR